MDVYCQGPREKTRKPDVEVPPLSCDCHAHVLGPQSSFPYVADRSFTPPDASSESFVAMLGTLGIERMIVVQPSVYGSDNRRTVAAVGEIGVHRARGVAMVDSKVTAAEVERLDKAGIRATRFIATARGGPSLDDLPAVARAIAPFGWHIEMYVPPQLWDTLLPVVADLPVPVVFDHMGGIPADAGPDHPNLKMILQLIEKGRAWVKLTGYRNSLAGPPYADGSISPASHGQFYELYAIAAAVLGGFSLRGGEGSLVGVILGTILLQELQNLVNLLGIPSSLNFAVMGGVILIGVLIDQQWNAIRTQRRLLSAARHQEVRAPAE